MKSILNAVSGITLIALVVTIVVLLILASVSITVVFGDNGILELAKEAGEKTNEALQNDKHDIQDLTTDIDDIINPPIDLSQVKGKVTQNTKISDKYGNKLTIPAGFEIVQNNTEHVEYTYDKNESGESTGIPTVQDGIVIRDDENYFVWIPIGTIKNRKGDSERGETSEIVLGRYSFDVKYNNETKEIEGTGKANLVQDALDYAKMVSVLEGSGTWQELYENADDYGNAKARNLPKFITNSIKNHGYWLARYEGVKGTDGKVKSKQSSDSNQVWTNITQMQASNFAQEMYEENENFETDLLNSYAWSTSLVFIQKYSRKFYLFKRNFKEHDTRKYWRKRG